MKILNLYAGLGGNRKLWCDSHDITAVEMEENIAEVYSHNFPNDTVVIGDAHEYLLQNHDDFDFVWSSPPCQTHSKMAKATRHDIRRYVDMSLYQEILFLQHFFNGKWVVENVKPHYKPLIRPSFEMGRHLFWCNFHVLPFNIPTRKGFIHDDSIETIEALKEEYGISYEGNIYYKDNHSPSQVLRNCVHPKIDEHILAESFRQGLFMIK